MSNQTRIENEMAYTTWHDSCQVHGPSEVETTGGIRVYTQRQCRRPYGHEGEHASGFGLNHRAWTGRYPASTYKLIS